MPTYHAHKIFRMGKKTGQKSVSPCAAIEAKSIEEAQEIFKTHPKFSDKNGYAFREAPIDEVPDLVAPSIEEMRREWSLGDKAWFILNEYEESPEWVVGFINEIQERGPGKSPAAVIWEQSYGSWRARTLENIYHRPPKGKGRKRKDKLRQKDLSITMPVKDVKKRKV